MPKQTIYQYASSNMKSIISLLLQLAEETQNFTKPQQKHWEDEVFSTMLLSGKGLDISKLPGLNERENIWFSRSAIQFDLEKAATNILYQKIQPYTEELINDIIRQTSNFAEISSNWIHQNPYSLPILMHVIGSFSKQDLKKLIGSANDNSISKPASVKLASYIETAKDNNFIPTADSISTRLKSTIEGIVRDRVGSLLEEFVTTALLRADVPFLRESDYPYLKGVVYDFRADFVIPENSHPKAFIEVRKSSSRHASLYAKDKMFSAINWKGLHQDCLGILIVDGPWSDASLKVMAKVFDYVVPVSMAEEVAKKIREYLDGNTSILQWLIRFEIEPFYKTKDKNNNEVLPTQ